MIRLALVVVLVLSSSSAFADPPCVPYNGLPQPVCPPGPPPPCSLATPWCLYFPHTSTTNVAEYGDFANVFLGVQGLEWTFVALKNKADVPSIVVIEVTIAGQAPVYRDHALGPQDRTDVQLNTWPELAKHQGGVSVVVRADQRTGVTIAMHPQITDASNPAQVRAFWQQAKMLEG